ncbi:sugar ABC transporter ATP-binding protein [Tateyamaria sp. ANG-S1]|uniref:sugar ABC transporter ATP-binding protein n=1 Tax=Tateyamaria sp. ANG-S1 TaxID=1577905 RepID=UPI00057E31FB|nr:sugar ABC transporter ATP-binding protein [Tateyamaria sp. ANG-S1]KIC48021.1 sugar ABC transporter ATP-binding protein [Tateyamaria sp. ANG-S1]
MTNLKPPLLEMQGISMHFGATKALDKVDFVCKAGEVHAILGENGAGKSTLMKLIAGVLQPTDGMIRVDGEKVSLSSPKAALRHGLVCMFQELSLVPDLTVRENLLLGARDAGLGWLQGKGLDAAQQTLARIGGEDIAQGARVADLTLPQRQQVEIAKAIMKKPRLLILDEATSALSASVVEKVFDLIREERDNGTAVLFISHRFHEIEALADRISVFRNGRRVETFAKGAHDYGAIIDMMVGQKIEELFPPKPPSDPEAEIVLHVEGLNWEDRVKSVNLTVRRGQIIGLGGLDGQGQGAFMMGLFGLLRKTQGTTALAGAPAAITGPKAAKQSELGLAYIPEDRKTEGLILDQSIEENLELAALGRKDLDAGDPSLYAGSLEQLALKHGGLNLPVSSLSGGNQQKVVLAKWLALNPRCLLLADPTRGIDVKTKTQIYNILRKLADQGASVILLSTDYEELIQLCDETHVFFDGQIVASLSGDDLTPQNIIAAALNVSPSGGTAHA